MDITQFMFGSGGQRKHSPWALQIAESLSVGRYMLNANNVKFRVVMAEHLGNKIYAVSLEPVLDEFSNLQGEPGQYYLFTDRYGRTRQYSVCRVL